MALGASKKRLAPGLFKEVYFKLRRLHSRDPRRLSPCMDLWNGFRLLIIEQPPIWC